VAQNNFLQSPFDALATATEESIYSLPPLPGQKSSTPTQVSEVPRDTRAPAVEQPEEPVAGQPVKAKPGQYLPPANLRPVFEAAAREFNVPVNVLMALGHQESRFNPAAIGPSTQWGRAKGMMQYLDSTASGLGINPFDPNQAVPAAARQLRERLDKGYSMEDAVKEHFAGPNRKLWGEKTAAYGREVMQKVGFIGEELGAGAPPAAAADPLADMNKAEPGRYRVATPEEVAAFEKKQAAMTEAERVEAAAQQKKNDDRGFGERASEALSSGTDNMVQSLNTSRFVMAGGDSQALAKALADKFAAGQERAKQKTTGEREMDASFQAVTDAEGVVDTTIAGAKAIGTAVMNPKDLAVGVIEQLPNMLPTMGAGVAGAGGGAAIGGGAGALAAGVGAIPGAITGAIVGGRAGMVAGTTATELGAEVEYMIGKRLEEAKQPPTPENIKALLDDPLFIGEARKQGLAKGLTVGLIDQLFMGLAGKVAGKTASATTKTRKVALGTGAVGLDATGEVVGEAASQQVARGEVDAGDALKEGVYGLGQSIVEPAVGATMQAAGKTAKAMRPGEAPPRVEPGTAPTATPPAAPAAQTPAAPQAPATPSGPLTAAVERAAETPAEQPQRVSVVAPEGEVTGFMESMQQDGQGGFVARILGDDGQVYNFTSADQVTITPEAPKAGPLTSAVEAAAETQPGAPVTQPAPTGSTPVEGAGSSQPTQVAPDFADLFDEQGRPKFPIAQTVRDFKKRTGLGQDGVRAIQAAIQEGRQITLEEAMQADKDARAERAAALEQDKKDSEAEAEKAKANAASPAKKREVVGEFEIPGLEGATNRVRVFRQGSRVDAVGLDEGTANNDLTALIAYGMTVEQALAQFYGDHAQGATPDASKVNRVDGRQDQTASKPLAEMDEPALRERLKYIASQGKANGWNKLLTNARREVEAEINKRTEGAKTDERADSAGVRVPDVSEGSVQADAPRGTDQPAGREGDAQLRDGVQADSGPSVPADGNAVPAAGAAADRQPALTPKQSAALDRIAKGTAFFGTPEKADAFIAKNEIGDTHEVVQTGKVRFEVKAKAPATAKGSSSVQADATPAIIPAGGTTTADEREPEQSKKQSKVLPREMDEDGRAKDGKPINPGDVFKTLSGRETSPYPKQKSERYASEWLIENAASEAESRGDKFNSRTFRATKPNKSGGLTTADRESMLMYLFGQQPDVVPSILKPLVPSSNRKPISVTKAGSGATAIVIDPSAMSGREPDLIKQLRENGSVQAEQIEQAKTELAAGDDSLAKDLLRINAPAVDQEPIKNETPAQQGSEAAEQASDQEKFSANRVKRAGGFFMDLKDVAKNGDNTQSPWLLSDGRIVGTGGDHISFAGQYLPGGAAGYSDFMKETGAVRASFFNDADRGYVATLHVAKGQNLTPEQLGALKFIESQRGAPMVVLFGAADGLVNPEFTETTVSALASDQETAPPPSKSSRCCPSSSSCSRARWSWAT
jgi:soluble lytic murein transglycosylase-like protein